MTVAESGWSENEIGVLHARVRALKASMGQVIIGQNEVIDSLIICLLAGGHALVEGVPGLGKTLLVKSLAQATDMEFRRVQFTPDLMPSDIVGTEILEEDHATRKREFRFQQGPVFTQVLLADEINRAPPKTQSALLEAMQERAVTFAGHTHKLPKPFFVLATQNPIEQAGTYPLPEAQLDRFLLHLLVDYPSEDEERRILEQTTGGATDTVPKVMDAEAVIALQAAVRQVHVSPDVLAWITRMVRASRPGDGAPAAINQWVKWGAGPRAGQSLVLAAKARALLQGRFAATREDVQALAAPVMRHRLLLSFAAEAEQKRADDVVAALLQAVPFPG